MNIIDSLSLVFIILFTFLGFRKGAIKTIVSLLGFFVVLLLSHKLAGPVCNFFVKHLPFFELGGIFKGYASVSILVYRGLSFLLVFTLLLCILKLILKLTGLLDSLLKATVILAIPSKIIGAILGFIEGIIFVFVFAVAMMHFGPTQKYIMESDMTLKIVEHSPIISSVFNKSIDASKEIYSILSSEESDKSDEDILEVLIRKGIVKEKDVENIKGKINKEGKDD